MTTGISLDEVRGLDANAEQVWPAREVRDVGGWRCRLDQGETRRVNSILAAADDGSDIDARCEKAESAYRGAGLRPCFQITPASMPRSLDQWLEARGYRKEGETHVMSTPPRAGHNVELQSEVVLRSEPKDDWLATYLPGASDAVVKTHSAIIRRISLPRAHASLRIGGTAQSVGMAVAGEGWGWINCMRTRATHRRRGDARAVLAALAEWGRGLGAERLYLQVEADNAPAQKLYEGVGFQRLYGYHYRVLD